MLAIEKLGQRSRLHLKIFTLKTRLRKVSKIKDGGEVGEEAVEKVGHAWTLRDEREDRRQK